jgi:hypothetical protein
MSEINLGKSVVGCMSAEAARLSDGEYLIIEENHVMNNKQLTFRVKIASLEGDARIRVGHGECEFNVSYVDVTSEKIIVCTAANCFKEIPHGLTVSDFVSISLAVGFSDVHITVASSGGVYQTEAEGWMGRMGDIFARCIGCEGADAVLRWSSGAYAEPIWLFGDSYFNTCWNSRWTSYLVKGGYRGYLLSGYPGRNSAAALEDFKRALRHGTPQYAVWCLGMNDSDEDDKVGDNYILPTKEFISLCEQRGIIPVLSTVPCTQFLVSPQGYRYKNDYKNEFVRKSGYRYIDFAAAVGSTETGMRWYDGMISEDEVHPTPLGAYALYARALIDFPELMQKRAEGVSK